jgi:NAD(P)H-dependent FMN reductase
MKTIVISGSLRLSSTQHGTVTQISSYAKTYRNEKYYLDWLE